MTEQQLNALDWPGWTIVDHTKYFAQARQIYRQTVDGIPVTAIKDTEGLYRINSVWANTAEEAFSMASDFATHHGGWAYDGS